MKVIERKYKDYLDEAKVQNEIFIIDGYDVEEVYQIAQHMVRLIEPAALRQKAKREKLEQINLK